MAGHYFDHYGKLIKKNAPPIKTENLPGLFGKTFRANILKDMKVQKSELSETIYKFQNKSKYFSSKDKLPEEFTNHMSEPEERCISDSSINLKFGVRLKTAAGEK